MAENDINYDDGGHRDLPGCGDGCLRLFWYLVIVIILVIVFLML